MKTRIVKMKGVELPGQRPPAPKQWRRNTQKLKANSGVWKQCAALLATELEWHLGIVKWEALGIPIPDRVLKGRRVLKMWEGLLEQ